MPEISFAPGMVLVLGALLIPFMRGWLLKAYVLTLPLVTLGLVWMVNPDEVITLDFLDFTLTTVEVHRPTRVFATIFSLMAFGGGLFALPYDPNKSRKEVEAIESQRRIELPGAFIYAGSAVCVTFAGDLFTMLVYWELMAIGSTLVVFAAGTPGSRRAGFRYVNVHLVGGVILMIGIVMHYMNTGSLDIETLTILDASALGQGEVIARWMMLIGILINAAAPPLGSWLADTYPEASESGTVFLSAYTTKTSVYVLWILFAGTEVLIYIGCVMAVYGIVYAILENDMRRILGYSIINQVGFMVCGIGIGTEVALNGAAAHAFAHIIYKALLLMSAGSVLYMTGKRKCTDLGGLYRTMPVTMWCGIIGALAISAFPLTSGFTTKSMITDAAATEHQMIAWFVLMAASAGVFLHAGIKFPWFVFFQKDSGLRPPDPPIHMKAAMILFSALCILIGVYPEPLYQFLPFPAPEGEQLYHAYSFSHVIAQLQLLLFSGLAFFVLLPMLKRTLTITLDFDWVYRVFFPNWIWRRALAGVRRLVGALHTGVVEGIPAAAGRMFRPPPEGAPGMGVTVGGVVVIITIMLGIFLAVNFGI